MSVCQPHKINLSDAALLASRADTEVSFAILHTGCLFDRLCLLLSLTKFQKRYKDCTEVTFLTGKRGAYQTKAWVFPNAGKILYIHNFSLLPCSGSQYTPATWQTVNKRKTYSCLEWILMIYLCLRVLSSTVSLSDISLSHGYTHTHTEKFSYSLIYSEFQQALETFCVTILLISFFIQKERMQIFTYIYITSISLT